MELWWDGGRWKEEKEESGSGDLGGGRRESLGEIMSF